MAHETASKTSMEAPTNTFGEGITGDNSSFDFVKKEMAGLLPILFRKVMYVNMASWRMTEWMYLVTFPPDTAAINSASVELVAVMDLVLQ
jgi:hypothetical protein